MVRWVISINISLYVVNNTKITLLLVALTVYIESEIKK